MNDESEEVQRLKALISRYIAHIVSCEGIDYLESWHGYEGILSEADMIELKSYSNERR